MVASGRWQASVVVAGPVTPYFFSSQGSNEGPQRIPVKSRFFNFKFPRPFQRALLASEVAAQEACGGPRPAASMMLI